MARLVRVLLALSVCVLLGAMLGRHFTVLLLGDPGAELWGWVAGVSVGLVYAAALINLSFGGRGGAGRVAGDMLLLAVCILAVAQLAAELSGRAAPMLPQALAGCYLLGLLGALACLAGMGKPRPEPLGYPPPDDHD